MSRLSATLLLGAVLGAYACTYWIPSRDLSRFNETGDTGRDTGSRAAEYAPEDFVVEFTDAFCDVELSCTDDFESRRDCEQWVRDNLRDVEDPEDCAYDAEQAEACVTFLRGYECGGDESGYAACDELCD